MLQPLIAKITLKGLLALILVAGTGFLLAQLGNGSVPKDNRDFFDIALGAWVAWGAMAVKRVFDGSDSSDEKNATITEQAKAINTAMSLPAAEPGK